MFKPIVDLPVRNAEEMSEEEFINDPVQQLMSALSHVLHTHTTLDESARKLLMTMVITEMVYLSEERMRGAYQHFIDPERLAKHKADRKLTNATIKAFLEDDLGVEEE